MLMNIIQKRVKPMPDGGGPPPSEYDTIPAGSEIYWYGKENELPSGFSIVTVANDAYIIGAADGDASDSKQGNETHSHGYDTPTGNSGDHNHTFSFSGLSGASGSTAFFPTANYNSANAGHTHGGGNAKTSSAGNHNHSISGNTGESEISPPHIRLYLIRADSEMEIPINGIFMWRGTIGDRPSGTSICDGVDGITPDMRGRFVKVTSSDANIKNSGGSATHSHSGPSLVASGMHNHSVSASSGGSSSNTKNASGYAGGWIAAGGHGHKVSGNLANESNHTHGTTNTESASSLPPFYALYFVMRTM